MSTRSPTSLLRWLLLWRFKGRSSTWWASRATAKKHTIAHTAAHQSWTEACLRTSWSDETKLGLFGDMVAAFIGKGRERPWTLSTVKHGGGGQAVGLFCCLVWVHGVTTKEDYVDIMNYNVKKSAASFRSLFQQDYDPKHASTLVQSVYTTWKWRLWRGPLRAQISVLLRY